MPLKKILFVSYYFPPLGGPGAIRPAKFCKYLPEFGWLPLVLTIKDIAYYTRDESLLADISQTKVFKSDSLDPARLLFRLGKKSVSWKGSASNLARYFNLPDSKLAWLPGALYCGLKMTKDIDLIFATAPPFTSLIIGLLLAQFSKKPFIADFRDAWLEFPFVPYKGLYKKLNYLMEKKVVSNCQHIITVSKAIKEKLIGRYPFLKDKITVIPNGYDRFDFQTAFEPTNFTITHLGTLRKSRNPEFFFKAMRELLDENQIDLKIKFIGNVMPEVIGKAKELNLDQHIIFYQHQPYKKAIEEFNSSNVLLLIADEEMTIFPSRQCEYLTTGLPIVVLGQSLSSEVFELARKKYSYPLKTINIDDTATIKKVIIYYYRMFKKRSIKRKIVQLENFDRRNQSRKLTEIFNLYCRSIDSC